jgi:hypothetical protein
MIDDWREVLEGWVSDSKGKIRGDKAHERLLALGYARVNGAVSVAGCGRG